MRLALLSPSPSAGSRSRYTSVKYTPPPLLAPFGRAPATPPASSTKLPGTSKRSLFGGVTVNPCRLRHSATCVLVAGGCRGDCSPGRTRGAAAATLVTVSVVVAPGSAGSVPVSSILPGTRGLSRVGVRGVRPPCRPPPRPVPDRGRSPDEVRTVRDVPADVTSPAAHERMSSPAMSRFMRVALCPTGLSGARADK